MDFYFDKSYFGTPFYLYCWCEDDLTTKLLEKPSGGVLCIGSPEAHTVAQLYGFTIPRFPSLKYRRFFFKTPGPIPWELVLPKHVYKEEVQKIVQELKVKLGPMDLGYYKNYFLAQNGIFKDLQPAKIDSVKWLAANDTQGHLKTFAPEQGGYAKVPTYTRTGTRTGRLKVVSGPMILNLKTEHRQILTSRFPGGSIWQFDYASLEPRILLAVNGDEDISEDLYKAATDHFGVTTIPRAAIKQAVLSRMFGAVDDTIMKQLQDLVDYPEDVLSLVDEYFHIDELRQKLALEFRINDGSHVTNYYGRPIVCEGSPLYVLLNYFIQSTGVDVALFGFNQVVAKIKQAGIEDKIVPLYILHDALFVDVHPDFEHLMPKLCRVGSFDIPKFENTNFHLQAKKEV